MSGARVALAYRFRGGRDPGAGADRLRVRAVVLLGLAGLFQLAPVTDWQTLAATRWPCWSAAAILRTSLEPRRPLLPIARRWLDPAPGVLAGVLLLQWLSPNVADRVGRCRRDHLHARPAMLRRKRAGTVSGIWFGGFGLLSGTAGRPVFDRRPRWRAMPRAAAVAAATIA